VTIRLRGAAGIGKTTLLDWIAEQSDAAVVRITGSESEAQLAYTGLASLLSAFEELHVAIPDPHDQVLADAVGVGSTPGLLTVGGAVLAALAAAADVTPLVLLIDDAQWLDEPSAAALTFALKRIADEPIVTIVAERSGFSSRFDSAAFESIEVRGMTLDDTVELLGHNVDPNVAQRCLEVAEGNPLALREFARLLNDDQLAGRTRLPDDLPVGDRLVRSFVDRVNQLDDPAKRAVAVAAAAHEPGAAVIRSAATQLGARAADLVAAEAAGIIRVLSDSVELTHPLMRTAIHDALGPATMRQAHAALANVVADADKRAWHLASAAIGPDAGVADALAEVAHTADRRGAWSSAAATWTRAAVLSPDAPVRHQRLLAAGASHWNAAEPHRAINILDEVATLCEDPLVRCDAIGIRSDGIAWMIDQDRGVAELAEAAQQIASIDPARAVGLSIRAGLHSGLSGRPVECRSHAQAAVDFAASLDGPLLLVARLFRGMTAQRLGDRDGADADLADANVIWSLPLEVLNEKLLPILQAVALTRLTQEQWTEANDMLGLSMVAARHHGLASVLGFSAALQGELYLRTGRLADAVLSSVYDVDLNDTPDLPTASYGHAVLARVEAVLGRSHSARSHAEAAIARARRVGMRSLEAWALSALGHVSLTTSNYVEAAEHLRRVHRLHAAVVDAGDLWYQGDLFEALFAIGAIDEAAAVIDEVSSKAERSRSKWGAAVSRRGNGLLHGRPDDLRESAELLAALGAPFEQARSLLLLGERHGDHEASRSSLRIFERLGAEPWAAQARRIAGPVAPTSTSLASRLTNVELRIAVSIARGGSNRQVADELYLSPKTVDAHLQSIMPKLGVRDRDELTVLVRRDMEQTRV
jgi:DNA-binding CsgD family transcriptional regulator